MTEDVNNLIPLSCASIISYILSPFVGDLDSKTPHHLTETVVGSQDDSSRGFVARIPKLHAQCPVLRAQSYKDARETRFQT